MIFCISFANFFCQLFSLFSYLKVISVILLSSQLERTDVYFKVIMQKISDESGDSTRLAANQKRTQFVTFDDEDCEPVPITAQPQNFSRNYNQPMSSSSTTYKDLVNQKQPFLHYAGTYRQNISPWLKNMNHSDQNTRLNSPESVIINFDNIIEPSTSHSVGLYGVYSSKSFPGQCQQYVSSVETTRTNDHEYASSNIRESSINVPSINCHRNQNQNNSINNTSISQNSEESQAENSNLNSSSGNQSLDKFLNKYVNFLAFLSLKVIYDHREGILIFVGLLFTFIHANSVVKREIAKQSRRSLISLGIIFVNLLVSICFIYFVFQEQKLYKNLIFIPPYNQPLSVWDVLWIVVITDFILKFITIQLKVGMACFPAKWLPYSSRGKWYLMLESASQLYRGLVPIQPWLYYLMEVYQGPENIVRMFFSVAYVVSKGSEIMSKMKLFIKAFWKLIHNSRFGVRPDPELLVTAGSLCPICHDEYNSPIVLQCRHVFCENCVSTWFDREQTCPLCRAKIADDPSWKDGATSLYTQLF